MYFQSFYFFKSYDQKYAEHHLENFNLFLE